MKEPNARPAPRSLPSEQLADPESESGVVATSQARELNPLHAALRRLSLFGDLGDDELASLARVATVAEHAKRTCLFRRGDPGGALLIVLSGVVEIVVEREGTEPVRLCTFQSGDFFGEMSLFDGQPRSATAITLVDSTLLAIDREALMSQLTPLMASRIMAEIAGRVRRTDATVSQLLEKVSRAAHSGDPNSAVAVELDVIKTLYRRTEEIAADTLARADKRALEVMARADEVAGDLQKQATRVTNLLKRWVAPVCCALGLALSWFGLQSFSALKDKLAEIDKLHAQTVQKGAEVSAVLASSNAMAAQLQTTYRRVRVLEETMGELRSVREASGIDRPIDNPEQLKRAALNHEQAKRELRDRYLSRGEAGAQYERFEPDVIFEAVDTYVTLAMAGGDDGLLWLSTSERSELLGALSYVLINLPDVPDATQPGHAGLLLDRKVRDMVAFVATDADSAQLQKFTGDLNEALQAARLSRARDNLVLTLAELGVGSAKVRQLLSEMLESKRPWRAAPAAIALAKLADKQAFEYLLRQLQEEPAAAYPVASLLAERGAPGLAQLVAKLNANDRLPQLTADIERVLRARQPRDCLEERYANYLLACLHGGCSTLPRDPESGSSCPSFSSTRH
jgi:CRP-like cAMP-binding protein